jgi:YidC/Oxa1 family membrane protein insertase
MSFPNPFAPFAPALDGSIYYFSLALSWFNGWTGSLGWAIVLFTLVIRLVLFPVTLPSIKDQKKIMDLKPELDKIKTKFKEDKAGLQQAQLELYKKYNINPLAGCLPQLAQFGVLIVLYQTLIKFLQDPGLIGSQANLMFGWFDLSRPDPLHILPILAAVTQLFLSLMLVPATETPDVIPNNSKKPKVQLANKKEEDTAEMAATMQQQMLFMMPIMTGIFAFNFPSGVALYWVITTIFSIGQQFIVSGPGGLATYARRAKLWFEAKGLIK